MDNFTLIIPTHNRHTYLKRSIEYFKNLSAKVLYCDSSSEPYKGVLPSNIEYLHLPNKKFAEKILIALDKIDSPIVATCADDDFILIEALEKGYKVLKNENQFTTVVGKYASFKENFNGEFYNMYNSNLGDINFGAEKNATEFFENYHQILWAMYDKKILENAFSIINQAGFNNDNFIEIVVGSCACYSGGIRFLDEIWGVRESSLSEHWGTRHLPIPNIENLEQNSDFLNFKKLMDENTSKGYAEIAMNSYLKGQFVPKSTLKSLIPSSVKNQIKRFKNLLFPAKTIAVPLSIDGTSLDSISSILKKNQ